jgi:hypothetical protein
MNRLAELCISIWTLLKDEEKEGYYYGTGAIGFVEDVAAMICFDVEKLTGEEFNAILGKLDR